jgi:hypothetical protein
LAICSGSIYFCILRKKWADDKKQVDFANKNIEMIMQEAVEDLDRIK